MLHTEKVERIATFMENLSRECWHWSETGMDEHPNVTVVPLIECWKAIGILTVKGTEEDLLEEAKLHRDAGNRTREYLKEVKDFSERACVRVAERAREFDILETVFTDTKTDDGWNLKPSQADHDARIVAYHTTAVKLRELVAIASDGAQFALDPLPEIPAGKIHSVDEKTYEKIVDKIASFAWDASQTRRALQAVNDNIYGDVLHAVIHRKERAVKTLLHSFGLCLKLVPDFGPKRIDLAILLGSQSEIEAKDKVLGLLESWEPQPDTFQPETAVHAYATQKLFAARAIQEEWTQKIITHSVPSLHEIGQEFTSEFDMVSYVVDQFLKIPASKKSNHAGDWFNTKWQYKQLFDDQFSWSAVAKRAAACLFK